MCCIIFFFAIFFLNKISCISCCFFHNIFFSYLIPVSVAINNVLNASQQHLCSILANNKDKININTNIENITNILYLNKKSSCLASVDSYTKEKTSKCISLNSASSYGTNNCAYKYFQFTFFLWSVFEYNKIPNRK